MSLLHHHVRAYGAACYLIRGCREKLLNSCRGTERGPDVDAAGAWSVKHGHLHLTEERSHTLITSEAPQEAHPTT